MVRKRLSDASGSFGLVCFGGGGAACLAGSGATAVAVAEEAVDVVGCALRFFVDDRRFELMISPVFRQP